MRLILILLLMTAAAQAGAEKFTYQDSFGRIWNRHILTEKKLLLVIDESPNFMQRTVLRKSFLNRKQMSEAAKTARLPHLQPQIQSFTPTNNPIWPIDRQWTTQDESDYSAWIQKIADEDFLHGGGLDVDCADYAITLRWIYAHDHHLPAGQQLAGSGKLFGSWQSTTDWDALPVNADWKLDERFKASLSYVLQSTYTHSLVGDLYPVEITPAYVLPGTIFLTIADDSGHTRTLINVGKNPKCDENDACMLILWGNEPASEDGTISNFVPMRLDEGTGGFLRFRWPELTGGSWQLRPPQNMPGYSTEQFTWPGDVYLSNVSSRLGLWTTTEGRFFVTGDNAAQLLMERSTAVQMGYFMCSLSPCSPQDSIYADWSTPVRDQAIAAAIKDFLQAAAQVDSGSQAVEDFNEKYGFPIFEGAPFAVIDIMYNQLNAYFSSDPTQDYFTRWGASGMDAGSQLAAYTEIIYNIWAAREAQVARAQALCFPQGGSTPTCDPNSIQVKNLSTARLDQAFIKMHTIFTALYVQASDDDQHNVTADLLSAATNERLCSSDGKRCTFYDYLFGDVDHWAKMTSNADAPYASRFGF